MQRYKIVVAYDGTNYFGWQSQKEKITVVGVLQATFEKVFNHAVSILGASRTDAGVHALGQVALCATSLIIDPERLRNAWNGALPKSILIRSVDIAADSFYPLRNVIQKTYWYHIVTRRPLPFIAPYCLLYRIPFDSDRFKAALQIFVGTHDFRSFCTGEYDNTVRTVDAIFVEYVAQYQAYRIIVQGPGFLRYMIRRMVGAALYVASHPEISLQDLIDILQNKNPLHTLPTAAAQGLVLRKIVYNQI